MKPTDQEKTAVKKIDCYTHRSQWEGHTASGDMQGSTRLGHEAEGVRGTVGKSLYCLFHGKEQVKQGKQA